MSTNGLKEAATAVDLVEARVRRTPSGEDRRAYEGDSWPSRDAKPRDPAEPRSPFRELAEYYARPELIEPPPEVVPRLAWQGRSTLLASQEKSGKSTLMRNAVAALAAGGEFLGGMTKQGRTLWMALDEPLGDLVRGLHELGVPGDAVMIAESRPGLDELRTKIRDFGASLMVIDCVMAFAEGFVTDPSRPTEWQILLRPINEILRETGAAAVLIHHTVRNGSRYADSRQLGASVDAILEMAISSSDETVRDVRLRGRIRSERFSLRYLEGRYELAAGQLEPRMRVYRTILAQPGIGAGRLRSAAGGKCARVDAIVRQLIERGFVRDEGGKDGHAYHVTRPMAMGSGHDWDKPLVQVVSHVGQQGTSQGQGRGQAPLSRPP